MNAHAERYHEEMETGPRANRRWSPAESADRILAFLGLLLGVISFSIAFYLRVRGSPQHAGGEGAAYNWMLFAGPALIFGILGSLVGLSGVVIRCIGRQFPTRGLIIMVLGAVSVALLLIH